MAAVIDGDSDEVEVIRRTVDNSDDALSVAFVGYCEGIGDESAM